MKVYQVTIRVEGGASLTVLATRVEASEAVKGHTLVVLAKPLPLNGFLATELILQPSDVLLVAAGAVQRPETEE